MRSPTSDYRGHTRAPINISSGLSLGGSKLRYVYRFGGRNMARLHYDHKYDTYHVEVWPFLEVKAKIVYALCTSNKSDALAKAVYWAMK